MWELDHKEGWAPKNWCFHTMVLEKTLESPLDSKEIKPVNPKGNPPWIFIGRTDAEAEALILWPPDSKSWFILKDLVLGKIEGKRRRGWQRMKWLNGITDSMDLSLSKLREIVKDREAWCPKSQTQLSNWTTTKGQIHPQVNSSLLRSPSYFDLFSVTWGEARVEKNIDLNWLSWTYLPFVNFTRTWHVNIYTSLAKQSFLLTTDPRIFYCILLYFLIYFSFKISTYVT